jgi:hypothetical protein
MILLRTVSRDVRLYQNDGLIHTVDGSSVDPPLQRNGLERRSNLHMHSHDTPGDNIVTGGCTRGFRLEARPWGSVPRPPLADGASHACWQRGPVSRNDRDHFRFSVPLILASTLTDARRSAVFALAGFLSPSNRGSLATVMIIFWTFSGRYIECLLCMDMDL